MAADEGETWVDWIIRTMQVAIAAMQKAKVVDWVHEARRRKWMWAGHVARRTDGRWTRRMMDWRPAGFRAVCRPGSRWEDSLVQFTADVGAENWREVAKDRRAWEELGEKYAKGMSTVAG